MGKEFSESFIRPTELNRRQTARGVNRAVYTLFFTPEHNKLHAEVSDLTKREIQPLHPSILDLKTKITEGPLNQIDKTKKRKLTDRELVQIAGVLVQFTDYIPLLQTYAKTPYDHIDELYKEVVTASAVKEKPLNLSEQLSISLKQTEGDLTESLWRLFITSRQHARWLDSSSITDLPEFKKEEKLERMITWQKSILGFKTDETSAQDAAGDTYYAWTHAFAGVAYRALPMRPSRRTAFMSQGFTRGTEIMHKVAHKYNPQTVINDHSGAADYGNMIGEVCSKALSE